MSRPRLVLAVATAATAAVLTGCTGGQPTGYARATIWVPVGWATRTAGTTTDGRDATGTLLLRLRHEAAAVPGNPAASLAKAFDAAAATPGTEIRGRQAMGTGKLGLPEAGWRLEFSVDGQRRVAAVRAWVLNDRLITVYVSGPAALEKELVNSVMFHGGDLRVRTYIGVDSSA